ncbi:MAG: redox-regulated ATPase YchF [Candidatus Gastranaerophilaceae bacterium]|jgi:ferrous iron transport protein B
MAFFDIIIRKKEVIYMSLTAGIVGLPNVGKSTLFNAITKKSILMANYPFATIDPNVGVVIVPDERIDVLKNMYNPERVIPTTYEFTDIAGLVKGASNGEGLGNKFLSHIREVDAVVEVVRCFDDENIIHVDGSVDPIRDIEVINVELVLSDLEIVTSRINRIGKKAMTTKNKDDVKEIELLERIKEALESNIPVRKLGLDEEEKKLISSFNLITLKPIIYALNVEDNDINTGNNYTKLVEDYAKKEGSETAIICAKLESELSELDEEEKKLFLDDLGIKESGVERLINRTYDLLGLATFFTVGKDEVRAWTFKKGSKAPECAGIIHSDFEKGFIKAEVMSYNDLVNAGSELKVRELGKARIEGKEYIMQDGDICHFRFNV